MYLVVALNCEYESHEEVLCGCNLKEYRISYVNDDDHTQAIDFIDY